MKVLLIEDDTRVARAIAKTLRAEGFAVDLASDGVLGEEMATVNQNDIILLDLMLPSQDGWTTCANIRRAGIRTPILMLTALDGVEDKITGLNIGADDYLPKPFHTGELLARIRALTRRNTIDGTPVIERLGVKLDTSTRRAYREEHEVFLTATEFALAELLLRNAGKIVTRAMISEHVWDMNHEFSSNLIEAYIRLLRRKLDAGFDASLIQTVRGAGYMFTDKPVR